VVNEESNGDIDMISKAKLKALEQSAYEGEKKRLKSEKEAGKTSEDVEKTEEAVRRGIAKARGQKVFVSKKTKERAGKVGGFLSKVGKQVAKNIAESQEEQRPKKRRKPAAKKKETSKKPTTKKRTVKK
jgi:hypothetical protein